MVRASHRNDQPDQNRIPLFGASRVTKAQRSIYTSLIWKVSIAVVLVVSIFLFVGLYVLVDDRSPSHQTLHWRFMTFNIEYGDVVAIQEACTENGTNTIPLLAALLGWNYLGTTDMNNDSTIISRWPLTLVTRGQWFVSAKVTPPLCNSSRPCLDQPAFIYVVSAHYTDEPYQPFQAANISYNDSAPFINDPVELANAAYEARGAAVDSTIAEAVSLRSRSDAIVTLVAGDFNEPSYLDWTPAAAANAFVPYPCVFPNTLNYTRHGFSDAYRHVYPDEVANRGLSWPGYDVDYQFRYDRIDFIFFGTSAGNIHNSQSKEKDGSGASVSVYVVNATVVQGHSPSDHRAVYAEFDFQW